MEREALLLPEKEKKDLDHPLEKEMVETKRERTLGKIKIYLFKKQDRRSKRDFLLLHRTLRSRGRRGRRARWAPGGNMPRLLTIKTNDGFI